MPSPSFAPAFSRRGAAGSRLCIACPLETLYCALSLAANTASRTARKAIPRSA